MQRKFGFYFSALWLAFILVAATKRLIRFFPLPDDQLNGDAYWTYLPNARKLLADPWTFLTTDPASYYVAPLGYIWAAVWGADHARVELANCVLFLACVLMMWRCATRLGGLWAGVIATSLLVSYPALASFIPQVLTESIYLFGLMLCMTAGIEYALGGRRPRLLLGLFAIGLTITLLSRPVLQVFTLAALIAALVLTAYAAWRGPALGRTLLCLSRIIDRRLCVALVAAILLPVAVIIKNGACFDVWALGTGAGSGLLYGVSPSKMGLEPIYSGFGYDASLVPQIASDMATTNPLAHESDRINARVGLEIIRNTSLADNAGFFTHKIKAWLIYSTPELQFLRKLRALRVFEWLAIGFAAISLALQARRRPKGERLRLPGPPGHEPERLTILLTLLLLVLAMAAQLAPVLYNTRYNLFFLEPWLMLLCGVACAILLQKPAALATSSGSAARGLRQLAQWLPRKVAIVLVLALLPPALARYAARHETWGMDPYRPGPVEMALDRTAMGALQSQDATDLGEGRWKLTTSPAALVIPLEIKEPGILSPHRTMDAIWRARFAIELQGEEARTCRKAAVQVSNAYQSNDWYEPDTALRLRPDGKAHTYALHGNDHLRPAGPGKLIITFHCPKDTIITWSGAELLRSTLPEAARALIQQGVPIDPYYRHEPR
ncbi:hypothetical protein [Delftia tsuruhatensis]|uniref:hypothetical protein n=1 Tax=Delftia tsuruhatensis TaxID=180282 RepID=UPI00031BA4C4|nr:hypothetical protein [Delftia tsuruhatensis]SFB62232.1 hypothetical protein SAMN05444579_11470 [Delftia tsuruhatensis]